MDKTHVVQFCLLYDIFQNFNIHKQVLQNFPNPKFKPWSRDTKYPDKGGGIAGD